MPKAFDKIKNILTFDVSLTHFGPKLDIVVSEAGNYKVSGVILNKLKGKKNKKKTNCLCFQDSNPNQKKPKNL